MSILPVWKLLYLTMLKTDELEWQSELENINPN